MANGLLAKGPVNSPKWVFFLRIAIVLFSALVLALAAWNIHLVNNPFRNPPQPGSSSSGGGGGTVDISGICAQFGISCKIKRQLVKSAAALLNENYGAAPALLIFATVSSLVTHVTVYVFEKWMPHNFFRICVFIAYVLLAIFLLSGWAYMASVAALWGPIAEATRKALKTGAEQTYEVQMASSGAAASALGAVLWVLVCINTVMFALACFRTEGEAMTSGATELHHVQKNEASVHVAPTGGPAPVYYSPTPQPLAQPYGAPPQPYQQGYVVQQQVPQ